jgi:DNA-binding HxlR family transcriptional regulator
MPTENGLSEPMQTMLFAIWKLNGVGNNTVGEDQLKTELPDHAPETLPSTLTQLQSLGFVEITTNGDRRKISITPLGVAILRKVEEDRLQEIR